MSKRRFIHFRISTTIGIASEIFRLLLARATLLSEYIVPIRVGWLRSVKSAKYPSVIYTAIEAPRIKQGEGFSFFCVHLLAFCEQLIYFLYTHIYQIRGCTPWLPHGQMGLYHESPELFRQIQGGGSRLIALRKIARAIRGFGPVTLRKDLEMRCKSRMIELGLAVDDWFVCLHVRTSAFHDDNAGYRNACFDNYRDAITHIIDLGGKVVRMGDASTGIINFQQAGLIDYPNSTLKSELMDLYLIKHCRFYIGTLSGILDTAYLFHTPTLCVNSLHFDLRSPNACDRVLYKRITRKGSNQFLSFNQAMDEYQNILAADWNLYYEFIENKAEEILASTKEFMEGLANHHQPTLRQIKARRKLIRKRLNYAASNDGGLSMLSASIAFSRCHMTNSSLDDWLLT